MRVVVKIGTSSLTDESGHIAFDAIGKVCGEIAELRKQNHDVVLVTSGAITAGLPPLGYSQTRPKDMLTLQAAAAVGQSRLLHAYDQALSPFELVAGQVLLSSANFLYRRQYVHARNTFGRLLQLGVIPVVNENDAVADDEIRWGDNDRLAALVANVVDADLLVLLTDTAGVLTADPRTDGTASLIEEVIEVDRQLELIAGGTGTDRGSGGMSSKVVAAHMAARSGVRAVIASAARPRVLSEAITGERTVGTVFPPAPTHMSARKLWIAYALEATGRIVIDSGARSALVDHDRSLLAAGVVALEGNFAGDDGVEITDTSGAVIAKGISRYSAGRLSEVLGYKTTDLPPDLPAEVVHRNDLVVLV